MKGLNTEMATHTTAYTVSFSRRYFLFIYLSYLNLLINMHCPSFRRSHSTQTPATALNSSRMHFSLSFIVIECVVLVVV